MMKKALVLLFVISGLAGCKNIDKEENQTKSGISSQESKVETCLFANGKVFSIIRQACVELDSLPFRLNPLEDGMMVKGDPAYLLFNISMTKAELILPEKEQGILLEQTNTGSWKGGDYILMAWKGYVIKQNDEPIYGGQ
ncbi:hypothetical protein PY092_14170 [Muricauda sp. 334s03]|uniref:Lipoprotein n=1 Tax=Flagellimonas yonaguniensis TaxID=3031325 RepID=A0ABT5Y1X2_9FLAO|nr:hypothetical protein [[Muricauda] yonaguniensis]MDF0717306.1 hypothetical protein [[Muricauda] yonaguniensis]